MGGSSGDDAAVAVERGADLPARRAEAEAGGGPERVAAIHASGRLTARERLDRLIDAGSWLEVGMLAEPELRRDGVPSTGDGVVSGLGRIDGRMVGVVAVDTTVLAGTSAPVNMRKQSRVTEWAGRPARWCPPRRHPPFAHRCGRGR